MTRTGKGIAATLAVSGGLLLAGTPAHAFIDIFLQGGAPVNLGGGVFEYRYRLELQQGFRLLPGNDITFFDFNGLLLGPNAPTFTTADLGGGGGVAGAPFVVTTPNVGDRPPAVGFDDPTLLNVNYQFSGAAPIGPAGTGVTADTIIGYAQIRSSLFGTATPYSASTQRGTPNQPAASGTFIQGPNSSGTIIAPEPGTFALLGVGMLGGLLARRRKKA